MRTRWWLLVIFLSMAASVSLTLACCLGLGMTVASGSKRRDRSVEEAEQGHVAAHEAGHAMVAAYLAGPDEVMRVEVYATLRSNGLYGLTGTRDHNRLETADDIMREAAVFMGGRAADKIVNGAPTNGAGSDLARVNDIIRSMHISSGLGGSLLVHAPDDVPAAVEAQIEEDINASNACAEAIVSANSETVVLLARLIMRQQAVGGARVLSGDEFRAFLREHPLRPIPERVLPTLMTGCHQPPH
jgi:ATP-dependent Zn protease